MKRLVITVFCSMLSMVAVLAQEAPAPGWTGKALKSIVSVNTYDKESNLLKSGTGFFVSSDGVAVADYDLFRDAYSASVVDQSGKKYEVTRILGANDTYGLVKFSTSARKVSALSIASEYPAVGTKLVVLAYSKDKPRTCPAASVTATDTVGGDCPYYSLDYPIDVKYQGCPVFNPSGELVATMQQPLANKGYAVGAKMAKSLSIDALGNKLDIYALDKIHIKQGLPETMEESLVYLYVKSRSAGNDEYLDLLNLFVETYPDNAEGYCRRVTPLLDLCRFDEADNDMQTYYKLAPDKGVAHSRISDLIYTKLVYQPIPTYDKWNFDLALEHIDKAIEADPKLDYKLRKGQILMAKKDYANAWTLYDEVNRTSDRSPAILYAESMASEGKGDSLDVQIEYMDSAIAMFPTPLPAEAADYVMRRARLFTSAGKYRDAVNDYNQYSYLNNSSVTAEFYYDRSQLEIKARMFQQALDDLDTAIGKEPNEPLYQIEKAALYLRVNQLDDCIATAGKVLEMDSNLADAYRIMGYAQIEKGDKVSARKNLQKAIDLGDESAKELMEKFLDK